MSGESASKSAEFPVIEVAATEEGAIISNMKGAFPSTTVVIIFETNAGQVISEEAKVKSVGGFRGSIMISEATKTQPLESLIEIV